MTLHLRQPFCTLALMLTMLTPLARAQNDRAQGRPFIEEQVKLESQIHDQMRELVERAVGTGKFTNVAVKVSFDAAQKSLAKAVSDSEVNLTLSPYAWVSPEEATAESAVKFYVRSVDVDVTFDSSIPDATQRQVTDLVRRSLSAYPAHVKSQKIASLKDAPVDRKPASEEAAPEKAKSLGERLNPWMPVLAAGVLLLGVIILSGAFGVGLNKVSQSMSGIAAQISMFSSQKTQGNESAKALPTPTKTDAAADKTPPPLSLGLRAFDKNQRLFKEFLNVKPIILMGVLARESDERLANLRALSPYLNEEEKTKLRDLIGQGRMRQIARFAGSDVSPSVAFDWLSQVIAKLNGQDLVGASKVLSKIEPADLKVLMSIKPEDLKRFSNAGSPLDEKTWRVLTELMPDDVLTKLMGELPTAAWLPILRATNTSDTEAPTLAKGVVERLNGPKRLGDPSAGDEDRTAYIAERLLPPTIQAQKAHPIPTELERWEEVYAQQPELRALVATSYWTLDRLSLVPRPNLKTWLEPFEPRLAGTLIYFCRTAKLTILESRLVSLIPEGMKKTIATSQVDALERAAPTKQDLLTWSTTLRAQIETLRLAFNAGKFKLEEEEEAPAAEPGATPDGNDDGSFGQEAA